MPNFTTVGRIYNSYLSGLYLWGFVLEANSCQRGRKMWLGNKMVISNLAKLRLLVFFLVFFLAGAM